MSVVYHVMRPEKSKREKREKGTYHSHVNAGSGLPRKVYVANH